MALNGHTNSPQHSGMKRSSSSEPPRANKRPSSSEGTPKVTSTSVGQTAPRLIATIKSADRQHRVENERNPYIHPPRGFDEEFDTSRRQPLYTPCKHYWTTQRSQTILPDHEIATPAQAYRLACFCQQCLWHVDIELQHTAQPCPKEGYPLHHFTNFIRENEHQEWYQARCSGCAATLYIHYRQPRLRAEQIDAMTNTERLAQRLNKAKKNDPDRGHARPAAPIEVLDAMATYLKDALSADALSTEGEKKIPKLNRRFVTSFGEECKDLLVSLGFKDVGEFWTLPRPEPPDPWAWNLRKQLEDTQEELWALMRSLKEHEPGLEIEGRKGYNGNMEPFEEDVQLFLSTMEYDKSKTTRRTPSLTLDEQSWYAGLGCLGDMSDGLIAFGYDRQVATDAGNRAYYFDCLSAIAKKRNSESLDMKMALLASEGAYGRRDVMDAYKYFVLSPHDDDLTDAHIRGVFESRMENIPKAGQTEAREKLRLIGLARGSQALQEAASNGRSCVSLLFLGLGSELSYVVWFPGDLSWPWRSGNKCARSTCGCLWSMHVRPRLRESVKAFASGRGYSLVLVELVAIRRVQGVHVATEYDSVLMVAVALKACSAVTTDAADTMPEVLTAVRLHDVLHAAIDVEPGSVTVTVN